MATVTDDTIADHSKQIQGLRHRLILNRLPNLIRNVDKQDCRYELIYRWYNAGGGVQGSECYYYPTKEMKPIIAKIKAGETLFDHFNLF